MQTENLKSVPDWRHYSRRVWLATLIITAVFGAILLIWLAAKVFLLFFASVLFAIFLRTCADAIGRLTHLKRDWSLAITVILLICICAGAGFFLATPVSKQIDQLSTKLPQALEKMEAQLEQYS